MNTLYELTSDLEELKSINEIENTQEIIKIIGDEINKKGVGLIKVDRIHDANIKALKEEVDNLRRKIKVEENNKRRLREYILDCMENGGIDKVETFLGNLKVIHKKVGSLKIENEETLPEKYIEIEQVKKIKKDLLEKDLKSGQTVRGAYISDPKNSLMIK